MNARILPYDWFKFIVLLILIALLISLGRCVPASPAAAVDESAVADENATGGGADQTADKTGTAEAEDSSSANQGTTEGSTEAGADTTGAESAGTGSETEGAEASAETESDSASVDCPKALPARISGVGSQVQITNALIPLRSSPEVAPNILGALPISSTVEITSLPVCTEYLDGANLWWGVRTQDGRTGFAAEGSAISPTYYLEEMTTP